MQETERILLDVLRYLTDILQNNISNISVDYEYVHIALRERIAMYGISTKCKGYLYIKEAVLLTFKDSNRRVNFKKNVYPIIAGRHIPATAESVEHAIRNAIKAAYDKSRSESGKWISEMSGLDSCPSNKRFILDLGEELRSSIHTELLNY